MALRFVNVGAVFEGISAYARSVAAAVAPTTSGGCKDVSARVLNCAGHSQFTVCFERVLLRPGCPSTHGE